MAPTVVRPIDVRRLAHVDARQPRGALEQRVGRDLSRPGRWRRPGYSPFAVTASSVVAVPKSQTMSGRPLAAELFVGGDRIHDAVGADFGGFSYRIGMPVLAAGSTMSARRPK